MCGIAGIVGRKANRSKVLTMLETQKHRGPDFTDYYCEENKIALGHNRLSIIDLSSNANQPFTSNCGNYVVVFNGEIYNYIELREELVDLGYSFKSQTDTEVILAAYSAWGTKAFDKFNGMWAFAIYDKLKNEIIDRKSVV